MVLCTFFSAGLFIYVIFSVVFFFMKEEIGRVGLFLVKK